MNRTAFGFELFTLANFGDLSVINGEESTIIANITILGITISRKTAIVIITILDAISTLICLFYIFHLIYKQKKLVLKNEEDVVGVSHYTVLVRNLPYTFTNRIKLAKWFEERFGDVAELTLSYDDPEILNLYIERGKLKTKINKYIAKGDDHIINKLNKRIQQIDLLIKKIIPEKKTICAFCNI